MSVYRLWAGVMKTVGFHLLSPQPIYMMAATGFPRTARETISKCISHRLRHIWIVTLAKTNHMAKSSVRGPSKGMDKGREIICSYFYNLPQYFSSFFLSGRSRAFVLNGHFKETSMIYTDQKKRNRNPGKITETPTQQRKFRRTVRNV